MIDVEDPRADLRWGTLPGLLSEIAVRRPDAEAMVEGDRRTSGAELVHGAREFAKGLLAAGMVAGDRVAIWAPNSTGWAIAALGTVSAGGILVTVNTRFKGAEAAYVLRASGAKVLVTVRGFLGVDYPALLETEDVGVLERIVLLQGDAHAAKQGTSQCEIDEFLASGARVTDADVRVRADGVAPTDVSDLLFTSGTTGRPKGVMMTHAQTLRTFGAWAAIVGLREDDRYLIVNPFFHTFGYKAGLLACLMTGATAIPEPVFDVDLVLRRIEEERVSVLPGPPTLYQSILAHPDRKKRNLSSLRLGVTGAAVVPVDLVRAMDKELGFETVLTAYGLTESCGTVTMCRRGDSAEVIAHTSGRAILDVEVRVIDAHGNALSEGEPGEVVVRGYNVMTGYWGEESASHGSNDAVDNDGWLHTGDIGILDAAGNLTITDRLKDMFVVGGFNAYPAEIESLLAGCPGITPLAVTGVPDDRLGEVGCVWLVRPGEPAKEGEGADGADDAFARGILEWARDHMANYKCPRYAVVLDGLPLNASGKVKKTELRDLFPQLDADRIHERNLQA